MQRAIAGIAVLAGLAVAVLGAAAGGFLHYVLAAYSGSADWLNQLLYSLLWIIPLAAGAGLTAIGSLGFRADAA